MLKCCGPVPGAQSEVELTQQRSKTILLPFHIEVIKWDGGPSFILCSGLWKGVQTQQERQRYYD